MSAAHAGQFPADQGVEVAFAGRSNAGKSSAINAILQRRGLARVSKTPGRTRLLNFFAVAEGRRIVDLPGYGYAAAPEADRRSWVSLVDALRERQSLRGLVLIVDSRRGIAPEDETLIAWARDRVPPLRVHTLLSKADKLNRAEATAALRAAAQRLDKGVTVQLFSALDGTGLREARQKLESWLSEAP